MAPDLPDTPPLQDLHAKLERTLIDDFLRARGEDPDALRARSDGEAFRLLAEASTYAGAKLAELESRAHYVDELRHRGGD